MPNYNGEISGFTAGNDIDIVRTITTIPSGQTLITATLTIKQSESSSTTILQKVITPSLSDAGIISGDVITFTLSDSDTLLLPGSNWVYYQIDVETSANKEYTPERGRIKGELSLS